MSNNHYTCPKGYHRNYKKEIVEFSRAFVLCVMVIILLGILFVYC